MSREVLGVVTAHQQREGAGFLVRRAFPTHGIDLVDPFLMLDEVGPVDYGPGEAIGAPDHPHRGFETVSYIVQGEKLHEDSTGKTQLIGPGDVQWMTAGSGIVHSELPSPAMRKNGGRAHGFQIWVNLPASEKFAEPGYQYLQAADIPKAVSEDGLIEVTVVAGEALGVSAAIGTRTPVWLQDWRVRAGGETRVAIDPGFNAAVYVFDGSIALGPERTPVTRSQLAVLGPGSEIGVASSGDGGGRFLLLAGRPIAEPVARYGPFVMNTEAEIMAAVRDYQSGGMGTIERR
ncbi:MAG: pirin family protein [Minwuia sp.]|uniref:pirin family protein n=1 Tax=Minwuia sp. TaxID=2493630 RepID=UPI003A84EF66